MVECPGKIWSTVADLFFFGHIGKIVFDEGQCVFLSFFGMWTYTYLASMCDWRTIISFLGSLAAANRRTSPDNLPIMVLCVIITT